jgi:hypothetical protein
MIELIYEDLVTLIEATAISHFLVKNRACFAAA